MLRRRVLALSIAVVACGAAVLGTSGSAGAAPPASTNGKTYVALGDSYAAGFGLPAPSMRTFQPVAGCDQTDGDYPHILAGQLGLKLTDVTCSGATTDDFTSSQDVNGPKPPPQLDVFKKIQPDLVTITIGGNDLGFTDIAKTCLAATPQGPVAADGKTLPPFLNCKAYFESSAGKQVNPYDKLPSVIARVKAAIAAVQKAAPKAKVAVIAYPAIAPDAKNTPSRGCYASLQINAAPGASALPFTDIDIPYLQVLQERLDTGIGTAAQQLGASYADIYPSSLSHSACELENTRWVEPVLPGDPPGTNVLHPNLRGTNAMADALNPVVRQLFAPVAAPTTTSAGTGASSSASAAPGAAGAAPLAATGARTPVGSTVLLGTLLVAAGAGLLVAVPARRRRRGAHR